MYSGLRRRTGERVSFERFILTHLSAESHETLNKVTFFAIQHYSLVYHEHVGFFPGIRRVRNSTGEAQYLHCCQGEIGEGLRSGR
jgi:hypothetical protein